jgi:hypothetical protein
MNETHKTEKPAKQSHPLSKKNNLVPVVIALVVLILLAVVISAHGKNNKSANKPSTGSSSSTPNVVGNAKLYIKPANQDVAAGSTVTLEIWVDTGGDPVNAVQANLTYPTDKFDFNSIDAKGSAFEVQAMSTGGDGKINIARGHIGDVKGSALVAKVLLVAKTNSGAADVSFVSGSAVVRSSDHKDILKDKTGGTFKVSFGATPIAVVQLTKVG